MTIQYLNNLIEIESQQIKELYLDTLGNRLTIKSKRASLLLMRHMGKRDMLFYLRNRMEYHSEEME